MADHATNGVARLPDEMLKFVLQHGIAPESASRLGRFTIRRGIPIQTPHYIATTSRGVIPHVSHDTLQKHTKINAVYFGLEDFIEKSRTEAPIFKTPTQDGQSALRQYTGLPKQCLSILGPRRIPRIACPGQNTNTAVAISTSVGFSWIEAGDYIDATERLRPDVSITLVDLVAAEKMSVKRIEKSADRSHAWLRDTIGAFESRDVEVSLCASIPPLEPQQQSFYLSDLAEDFKPALNGICTYAPNTVPDIPLSVQHLPRICIDDPQTPHSILRAVSLGVDLITLPFITSTSEQGIAFSFTFLAGATNTLSTGRSPLALDLWSTEHATSLLSLQPNCTCYTCTRHHRAYIHHLLHAKEMLAWTLLQIHNFHVIDSFFASVRDSIANGTFERDMQVFARSYEDAMPEPTGDGPRIRGYQMKSVGGGEGKKNRKVWGKLDDVEKMREAVDEDETGEEGDVKMLEGGKEMIEEHGLGKAVSDKAD